MPSEWTSNKYPVKPGPVYRNKFAYNTPDELKFCKALLKLMPVVEDPKAMMAHDGPCFTVNCGSFRVPNTGLVRGRPVPVDGSGKAKLVEYFPDVMLKLGDGQVHVLELKGFDWRKPWKIRNFDRYHVKQARPPRRFGGKMFGERRRNKALFGTLQFQLLGRSQHDNFEPVLDVNASGSLTLLLRELWAEEPHVSRGGGRLPAVRWRSARGKRPAGPALDSLAGFLQQRTA